MAPPREDIGKDDGDGDGDVTIKAWIFRELIGLAQSNVELSRRNSDLVALIVSPRSSTTSPDAPLPRHQRRKGTIVRWADDDDANEETETTASDVLSDVILTLILFVAAVLLVRAWMSLGVPRGQTTGGGGRALPFLHGAFL